MGATNLSMSVKGNESAVRKAFKAKVADDLHQYGHDSYNGSFTTFDGLEIKSIVLDGLEAAYDYLEDQQQKWGPAFAVRYKVFKSNKSMETLARAINALDRELWKGGLTDRKRKSLEKKKNEKTAKLLLWRAKKAAKVKRTMWLVGGWAAC